MISGEETDLLPPPNSDRLCPNEYPRMKHNPPVLLLVFLLFLLCAAAPVFGAHLEGTVMTVLITSASTVDERLEDILTDSVLVALERHQIQTTVADLNLRGDEPSRRDIARLARVGGSEFVLVGTYNPSGSAGNRLSITFSLYLVEPPIPVAVIQGTTWINLVLDRSIRRLVDHLLEDAFEQISE